MTTTLTALHWGGYIDIDLLFAAFSAKSKSPKRTPGPPDIEDVASTVETINDIVDEVSEDGTPDKEIMEESASNINELIVEEIQQQSNVVVDTNYQTYQGESPYYINDELINKGDTIGYNITEDGVIVKGGNYNPKKIDYEIKDD